MTYDSTADILAHRKRVQFWLDWLINILPGRGNNHDESKLHEPEKLIFDESVPKLKILEFGSEAYKQAVASMGEGLKHHYAENEHHPEHFKRGIAGMCLWDFIEMVADWMASASVKNEPMNLDYLQKRFDICPQLLGIIANTLHTADMDLIFMNIPLDIGQVHNYISQSDFEKYVEVEDK